MRLNKGAGIFPDGTLFDISEPLSLTVHEIPTFTNVYLAIPVSNGQEFNLNSKNDHSFRYQVTDALCQDITQPSNNIKGARLEFYANLMPYFEHPLYHISAPCN